MKFRTDFVTNSSSTSYLTITASMLDGTEKDIAYEETDGFFYAALYKIEEKFVGKKLPFETLEQLKEGLKELYIVDIDELSALKGFLNKIQEGKIPFDKINEFVVYTSKGDLDIEEFDRYEVRVSFKEKCIEATKLPDLEEDEDF